MSFSFSDFTAALKAGAPISADDVLAVRRWVWPDGSVSEAEAEVVFELNRLATQPCAEWASFFVEAMAEYVVNGQEPRGYVDEVGADWLIEQIDRGGEATDTAEIELVAKVLEKALNAPASLKSWALQRIEAAVLGDGRIGDEEVRLLRRIVFACGGDGALVVSEGEAETLWRIKDACLGADNGEGWKSLFVQGVGNHVMAHSTYRPLEREEARRLEAFVGDHRGSVLGFFGRMRLTDPAGVIKAAFDRGPSAAEHDAAVDAARAVTPIEKVWLDASIGADGKRDEFEEALLAFIAEA
jgi:hypothetical protein